MCSGLYLADVMDSFFGQMLSRSAPSSAPSVSGYCSSSLVRMPRCTDDLSDEGVPRSVLGSSFLKNDMVVKVVCNVSKA